MKRELEDVSKGSPTFPPLSNSGKPVPVQKGTHSRYEIGTQNTVYHHWSIAVPADGLCSSQEVLSRSTAYLLSKRTILNWAWRG